ncbi:GntR family transcriptional regulator, partial [Streptomyces sp. 8L]|uniref:GntR family transcriptional regulator n=1 Tax=Streptomyces sp. 8L TaxID=2877242 RepID=UPI001CD3965C
MPDGGAVTRHTLRQQIADALRDEILAGRLLPGREFSVRTIAEQYGVSATPVREALVDLCAQGLLDSDQHKGFRVHSFSLDDFRGMVEARSLLEDGVFRKLEQTLPEAGDCPVTGLVAAAGGRFGVARADAPPPPGAPPPPPPRGGGPPGGGARPPRPGAA